MKRYLEYCSERLAITSKLAALQAQGLNDPVVLGAVNDIESLCSDLSRKIWQKITIFGIAPAAPGSLEVPLRRPLASNVTRSSEFVNDPR